MNMGTSKRVIVVGLGKSGVAAARLCLAQGHSVTGTDSAPLSRLEEACSLGIPIQADGHEGVDFEHADLVVVSPGVPAIPGLERAQRAGVEVIGEVELASRFLAAPILAVGGTNGKSTTTTLLGTLLAWAGLRVFVGGNLGTPASAAVGRGWDAVVLEVSSFQLERAATFRPKVSILLNITEDHLDRYSSFAAYAQAKGNAFARQLADDVAVVPHGDALCAEQARRGRGRLIRFGVEGEFVIEGTTIAERDGGERYELSGTRLYGRHNHANAAAAIAAARQLGISPEAIRNGLAAFEPLPHRMALAGALRGVRFYDDSKGTNVGAAVTALHGLLEPRGVLIAGGRDKQGSYAPLVDALVEKGRAVVVLGEAADRIAEAVGARLPVARVTTMEEAVRTALSLAEPGDAVLLSPACSSFDMFKSYAERGDVFVRAVEALAAESKGAG